MLDKGVAVGRNDPEKRPFIGHSMTIVNLYGVESKQMYTIIHQGPLDQAAF